MVYQRFGPCKVLQKKEAGASKGSRAGMTWMTSPDVTEKESLGMACMKFGNCEMKMTSKCQTMISYSNDLNNIMC